MHPEGDRHGRGAAVRLLAEAIAGPVPQRHIDAGTLPWQATRYPGFEIKVLLEDKESGPLTALCRALAERRAGPKFLLKPNRFLKG